MQIPKSCNKLICWLKGWWRSSVAADVTALAQNLARYVERQRHGSVRLTVPSAGASGMLHHVELARHNRHGGVADGAGWCWRTHGQRCNVTIRYQPYHSRWLALRHGHSTSKHSTCRRR
mgnify:CR=1 FL=1